jgi:hypothetical protein
VLAAFDQEASRLVDLGCGWSPLVESSETVILPVLGTLDYSDAMHAG